MKTVALIHFSKDQYLILKRKLSDEYKLVLLEDHHIKDVELSLSNTVLCGSNDGVQTTINSMGLIKEKAPFCQFIYCDLNPKTSDIVAFLKCGVRDVVELPSFTSELIWVIEKTMQYQSLETDIFSSLPKQTVRQIQKKININCSKGLAVSANNIAPYLPLKRQMVNKQTPVILLVEDNDIIRKGYALILKDIGSVLEATDIKSALTCIKSKKIHVVVIDIKLPDGTGDHLINEIKHSQKNCEVLIMSAYRDIDSMTQCFNLGACDYLMKSSDLTLLRSKVAQSLQNVFLKELKCFMQQND